MDKEQIMAADLEPAQRPINQHWSWDRILRSCFIKQADVLQGISLLDEEYDEEAPRRNFDFYEPRTVHEGHRLDEQAAVPGDLAIQNAGVEVGLDTCDAVALGQAFDRHEPGVVAGLDIFRSGGAQADDELHS